MCKRSLANSKMTLNTQGAPIIVAERIIEWRSYLQRRRTIDSADIAKFEQQLMAHHVELQKAGLDDDEAFLIAVKRIGDQQSRVWGSTFEFADQLWKQLNAMRSKNKVRVSWGAEAVVAIGLAIAAALAIKVPELMGVRIDGSDANPSFYARNLSLFVLPFLAVYFVWKREVKRSNLVWMITPFALAAVLMNVIPFASLGSTELLAALHLPIAMWMLVGLSYASGNWRDHDHRMNYVRFSGEWFICYSLIALGGGVFMGITNMIFSAISLDVEWLVSTWILPCGAMGAVIIAGWLVESKQNLLESMAPILTLLFTPLFTVLLFDHDALDRQRHQC